MERFDFDPEGISQKLILVGRKATSLSLLRLFTFFAMIGLFVLGVSENSFWLIGFLIVVAFFIDLIQRYNLQKDQESIYLAIQKLAERTQKRQKRDLTGLDTGAEFLDKLHPFANDLDLFGDHSLFQLLNHTTSENAKIALSERLKADFDWGKMEDLRAAAEELATYPEFLRAMESIGLAFYKGEESSKSWTKWLKEPTPVKSWILIFAILGPIGGLILSALVFLSIIPAVSLGIWILVGMIFLAMAFKPLKSAAEEIPSRNQLKIYRLWIAQFEHLQFKSAILRAAQSNFLAEDKKASKLLEELDRLGLWVQNRLNMLYFPLNLILWTDLALWYMLGSWKKKQGEFISMFPSELENWEILVSLGAFESELGSKAKIFQMSDMGLHTVGLRHPLLEPNKAIANDFIIDQNQRIVLLTGSNMSGKTTFMRTLGINCVLMNLGLKPFADEFAIGPMQLFTSMRNADNLGESVSSFYAELSRIRTLIQRLEQGEKMFFLLDEILKGTNTADRIAGSEALIRQMQKTNSVGIISTHDIELAGLENKINGLRNFSFHSEVYERRIDFDYKIKSGACPSFNAHKLMELMGIKFQEKS